MKVLIAFAATLLAVNALTAQDHWTNFKAKHDKNYQNILEERVRFQIFQNNLKKINEHNTKYEAGLETYTMGVNKFADMTQKEFGAMLKRQNGVAPKIHRSRHVQDISLTVPDSIDWRQQNAVMEVKDQGNCGSCWAFSSTGGIEGQNAILNNKRISLSEQQLLDCSGSYGNGDCNEGGNMQLAFEYVIDNGINTEAEYPYEAVQRTCRAKSGSVVAVKDINEIDATETALKAAVGTVGPISVAMYAEPIQFYQSGIFESSECYNDANYLDHGILAVGYGTENGKKFWIIKNSWAADWGESGFFRLARDANQCGIALDGSYPVL